MLLQEATELVEGHFCGRGKGSKPLTGRLQQLGARDVCLLLFFLK